MLSGEECLIENSKADYYVNRIQPNANYSKKTMQIYVKYIILTNNFK